MRGGRPHVFSVSLSDAELEAVRLAAAGVGMAPGAWLSDTGVRAARGELGSGGVIDRRAGLELLELRAAMEDGTAQLRRAGVNLNQLTARLNATDVIGEEASTVLVRVDRAVAEIATALVEVARWTRETGSVQADQAGDPA